MDPSVRRELVSLREFSPAGDGEAAFDLADYAVGTLRDETGRLLFTDRGQVDLESLIEVGALPADARNTRVALTELFPHSRFGLTSDDGARRTSREVIKNMVDATVRAGADAIMLDTSILLKVARVSLLSTAGGCELLDFNALDIDESGLDRRGILSLEDLRFFVSYCHYAGLEANIAGSVESFHAQQIWRLVPEADQIATRGAASALRVDPSDPADLGEDSRRDRVITRGLVGGLVPPEQGGYLVLPDRMKASGTDLAREMTRRYPGMAAFWSDPQGRLTPFE